MGWGFNLLLSQPLSREQADRFDHCDALADGGISYTMGPGDPDAWPCRADPELRSLPCDVEAPSLLDAVAQAVQRVRLIEGLRVVGVVLPDSVTLEEAAQRSGCDVRRLAGLCRDRLLPEYETTRDGTALFSWAEIAGLLRDVGDRVPDVPQDVVVADRALWLVDALEGADVPPGVLASLGLPVG